MCPVTNIYTILLIPVLRIRDVYPGFPLNFTHRGSRISDPGSKNSNKREGWKKICCHNFLGSHKFLKIANYFSFKVLKKKIWANFQRIIEFFIQKIVNKLSKIRVGDPGSEIRKKPIPDPGSRGQKGTGSRIRIRNTDWYRYWNRGRKWPRSMLRWSCMIRKRNGPPNMTKDHVSLRRPLL